MKATPDESPGAGRKIRTAREVMGLSREEFARQARVSTSTVARIELNDLLPSSLALARVASVAAIPLNDLLPEELRVSATAAAP